MYSLEFEGDKKFLRDFGIWCKVFERDTTAYDSCVKEVTPEAALTDMNEKLKAFLDTENKGDTFVPYATVDNQTLANYCQVRFDDSELNIHNKFICLDLIS
jgi:hypothetical protein